MPLNRLFETIEQARDKADWRAASRALIPSAMR